MYLLGKGDFEKVLMHFLSRDVVRRPYEGEIRGPSIPARDAIYLMQKSNCKTPGRGKFGGNSLLLQIFCSPQTEEQAVEKR